MKRSEYLRICVLFEKWKNWLLYLTASYIFVFLVWSLNINPVLRPFLNSASLFFIKSDDSKFYSACGRLLIAFSIIISRGSIFCLDGIVSSWLKSPFGQISFSINKSNLENWKADEIVTILTEVNEHFKETFKKFGVFTLASDIFAAYKNANASSMKSHLKNKKKVTSPSTSVPDNKKRLPNSLTEKILTKNLEMIGSIAILVPIAYAIYRMRTVKKMLADIELEDD